MKRIHSFLYQKTISDPFDEVFSIEQEGIYIIEISARAKSWWQNTTTRRSFLRKDSLTTKVNGREIFSESKTRKIFANDLWNGNILKNNELTVYLISRFNPGNTTISFDVHGTPHLEYMKVFLSEDSEVIMRDISPSWRDRIPWMVFLAQESFDSISITASADVSQNDDDDLQISIDSKKILNGNKKSHRDWFWCGKVLHGSMQTFSKVFAANDQPLRIDLFADGTPHIESLYLRLGSAKGGLSGKIALYEDIEKAEEVNMRADPNLSTTIITKVKDGEIVEILERIVEGEEVLNKSKIWHKIRYKGFVGYILSSFVEIAGEGREQIQDLIKEYAKKFAVDGNLAVSLAGCESHYKPYATSYTGALGIFQLTSIARKHLSTEFQFSITDSESLEVEKNIEAGVRYLQWLAGIYQDVADSEKKIIAAWNAGSSLISTQGKYNLAKIPTEEKKREVESLVSCVLRNKQKSNKRALRVFIFIILLVGAGGTYALSTLDDKEHYEGRDTSRSFLFRSIFDGNIESVSISLTSPQKPIFTTTSIDYIIEGVKRHRELSGYLLNAYVLPEYFHNFLFVVREEGHYIATSIMRYEPKMRDFIVVPFVDRDGQKNVDLCCGFITFQPRSYGNYDLVMYEQSKFSPHVSKKIYTYSHEHGFVETSK